MQKYATVILAITLLPLGLGCDPADGPDGLSYGEEVGQRCLYLHGTAVDECLESGSASDECLSGIDNSAFSSMGQNLAWQSHLDCMKDICLYLTYDEGQTEYEQCLGSELSDRIHCGSSYSLCDRLANS